MSDFDKGEELHVTLSIAFEFSWTSSHLLIPNIADKERHNQAEGCRGISMPAILTNF
jgi:hypothetical protein